MELKASPQVNGSSEAPRGDPPEPQVTHQDADEQISREDIIKSAKYPSAKPKSEKSASPPPPPRPGTPLDERDPEQVYAERRYLSYFQEPPYKQQRTRSTSREPKTPDLQQIESPAQVLLPLPESAAGLHPHAGGGVQDTGA